MMRAYERLLKYTTFPTPSCEASDTIPSSACQLELGKALVAEMKELGISDAKLDEFGYVYGSIPANTDDQPAIGLIAHMDVVEEPAAAPVKTTFIRDYDGNDITLANGDVMTTVQFPELKTHKGKTLIVTDGNTTLGADDKAGIAEILTAAETILNSDKKHGKIGISFTPDEEIGRGPMKFDVKGFGCDFGYTVDGGTLGGISYENFNAASGRVIVHGVNIHPGSSKNCMKNSVLIGMEFNSLLPAGQIPALTEEREGFFHLGSISGNEELTTLTYIIRDHDKAKFEAKKQLFADAAQYLNKKYGDGTVEVIVKDSYFNMLEIIKQHPEVITRAENAFRAVEVEPFSEPIRGGTDGATISYMGMPCPNLSTGGMNAHSRHECVTVEDMDKMADMLVKLVTVE